MSAWRWLGRLLAAVSLWLLHRARTVDVPFSPVFGGPYIGATFPERRGLTTGERPAGEMDDMAAYARAGDADAAAFDPDAVDPEVRAFYERTAAYRMRYRTRWHRGFRTGAALAGLLTRRIGQLDLPGPWACGVRELDSRFLRLRPDRDPRAEARAWVRTDPGTGRAVFVALYGSHVTDGERLVNIAAPLPGSNLSTVLRLQHLPHSGAEATGVELTTRGAGDPGLYLVTPASALALPMTQRFRVWPVDAPGAPTPIDGRATLVAAHEMWLLGRLFLTVEYAMWPAGQASTSTS